MIHLSWMMLRPEMVIGGLALVALHYGGGTIPGIYPHEIKKVELYVHKGAEISIEKTYSQNDSKLSPKHMHDMNMNSTANLGVNWNSTMEVMGNWSMEMMHY